jgi:hypothetical protein
MAPYLERLISIAIDLYDFVKPRGITCKGFQRLGMLMCGLFEHFVHETYYIPLHNSCGGVPAIVKTEKLLPVKCSDLLEC